MKIKLEYLQNLDHETAQREPKPSLEEASEDHDFIFLRSRTSLVSIVSPHNRNIPKITPLILSRWFCLIVDFSKTAWLGR
jgi:hypothetical protein